MSYDDETLMAYVDGELDAARRAEIEAAAKADAPLAERIAAQRELRERVTGAFANVAKQQVPERLLAAARGPGAEPNAAPVRGNVVQFPSRGTRAPPTAWRAREWTAMAASLLLGVFLAWRMLAPKTEGPFEAREALLPTLLPLLERQVGRLFLPWSDANARAIAAGSEVMSVELDGKTLTQKPQKYHAKSLAELRRRHAAVTDRTALDPILERSGCLRWLRVGS